jgi:hypothetical protein
VDENLDARLASILVDTGHECDSVRSEGFGGESDDEWFWTSQIQSDMTDHIRRVFDAYGPRRSYWGTDLTNSHAKANYSQRLAHFNETLDFLSEEHKDWVMGRAILERLKWG